MAPSRQRKKVPNIPLKPDYDESTVEYLTHRRSEVVAGVTEEIQQRVPILPTDATPFLKLKFFAAFTKARRHLQWTTGPRLFQRFEMHLSDLHLATWEAQAQGVAATVANFNQQYAAFKTTLLSGYRYHDQMDFLRQVKKQPDQSPSQFVLMCSAAEAHAIQLPDAPVAPATVGFTAEERRRNLLQAMPSSWQDKFIDANMTTADETLATMQQYFDRLYEKDPFEPNQQRGAPEQQQQQQQSQPRRRKHS